MNKPNIDSNIDLKKFNRRSDLDALRVMATILLIYFHTAMIFNLWASFHIQNDELSLGMALFVEFFNIWHMPLFVILAGMSSFYALEIRSGKQFTKDRAKRLLIPLLFGILLVIPPQVYIERIAWWCKTRQSPINFTGSYFDFYPYFFIPIYPEGNLSWHHLWFVAYLFVFSMLTVPVLAAFGTKRGQMILQASRSWLAQGGRIYLLILPLAVIQVSLRRYWPTQQNLVADWANFSFQLFHFWAGILVASDPGIWDRISKLRRVSLGLGLTTLGGLLIDDAMGVKGGYPYPIEYTLLSCLTWFWILIALGYGKHYLNFRNRFISYANEGIYPFYILHQTVIVVIGYYLVRWRLGPTVKFGLLLMLSFAASVAIYEFLIRRWDWVRPCFGLKSDRAASAAPSAERVGREAAAAL